MVKYTDAPEVFHSANAVTLLGAALTRQRYRCLLAGGVPARWTNLWTFVVGDSAESRKSTTVNMAAEVLSRAMPELRAPDDGSPEGFAKDFVDKDRKNAGDAAGFLLQSEMGMFLMNMQKDYARPLKGMLMDFYDVPVVYRKRLSKDEFSVERPRFSMLGAVATELLPTLTTSEDWLGGFMNRAMLIHGKRDRLLERAQTPPETLYRSLANGMLSTLSAWRKTRMKAQKALPKGGDRKSFLFDFDDDALKEMKVLRKGHKKPKDPNVVLLLGRADVHIVKLAAIHQISMDPESRVISKAAVRNAWPLYDHWWRYAPGIMETAFARGREDLEGDRLARRLLRHVREAGPEGATDVELMRSTVFSLDHFTKAMASLEAAEEVVKRDMGDGQPSRVFATRGFDGESTS